MMVTQGGRTGVKDVELEPKIKAIQEILKMCEDLAFKLKNESSPQPIPSSYQFKLPVNMQLSLFDTFCLLLNHFDAVEKDFMVLKVLQTIQMIIRHDSDFITRPDPGVEETSLSYIRWFLTLIKDRQKVTADVVESGFEILHTVCTRINSKGVDSFLPQLSSVMTKVLSNTYKQLKHRAHLSAIKVWRECLLKYFQEHAAEFAPETSKKVTRLQIDAKTGLPKAAEASPLTLSAAHLSMLPLASCFKHLFSQLFSQQHKQVFSELGEMCLILLTQVPAL